MLSIWTSKRPLTPSPTTRPKGKGVYIRQIPFAHVITNIYSTMLHCTATHVSNKLTNNFKPTITTRIHLLGYYTLYYTFVKQHYSEASVYCGMYK